MTFCWMKTALINSVKSTCVNRRIKEIFRLNQERKKWLINENDVECVCLLDKNSSKPKDYIEIDVDAEDYYRIKDSEKNE